MKIKEVLFEISATKPEHYPHPQKEEVVFLGRSNVGKSSFINSFTNKKKLAYTSSTPGKTQVINFFLVNESFYLVDVPGYGYARVSKKQREAFGKMIEKYLTIRESLKMAVLLVDFKVGPTEDDIMMYEFLKYYNIQTLIVATKKDKVKNSLQAKHKKNILNKMQGLDEKDLMVYSKEIPTTLTPIYSYFEKVLDKYE